jgi:hypothetical protein
MRKQMMNSVHLHGRHDVSVMHLRTPDRNSGQQGEEPFRYYRTLVRHAKAGRKWRT